MGRAAEWIGLICCATLAASALAQDDKGVTAATKAVEDAEPPKDEQAFFTALTWRNIGPNRGGRSISAVGSTARPNGRATVPPAKSSPESLRRNT